MNWIVFSFVLLFAWYAKIFHAFSFTHLRLLFKLIMGPRSRGPLYPRHINMLFNLSFMKNQWEMKSLEGQPFPEKSRVQFSLSQVFEEQDLSLPSVQGEEQWLVSFLLAFVLLFDTWKHFMHFHLHICVFKAHSRRLVHFGLNFSISYIVSKWSRCSLWSEFSISSVNTRLSRGPLYPRYINMLFKFSFIKNQWKMNSLGWHF